MTAALDLAKERLERYELRRPDVTALACYASLAVRIDPQLLRRLRLELLPDADVGTEADLWFSPLVESRGVDYAVLQPPIAQVLRERLKAQSEAQARRAGPGPDGSAPDAIAPSGERLLHRVAAITLEVHQGLAPTLRLEERLNALALEDGPGRAGAIDEALRPALRTLRAGSDGADAVAQWALGAFLRFHPTVWQTPNALALRYAAYVHLGLRRRLDPVPETSARGEEVAWLLPQDAFKDRAPVGVQLLPRALRFVEPGTGTPVIEVPSAVPPAVTLTWVREGKPVTRMVEATPGRMVDLGAEPQEVTVGTLTGDEYLVAKAAGTAPPKKKCFVVMGVGQKTDFATGRTLDLDKTYRIIIKKAVEEAGLECIRADDIIHAGIIDKPMYELLLEADVVVADLSTSNPNALYELGVRHALRPHTTIVIAEKGFKFPFDIKSLLIRGYEHLGTSIDGEEADRVRSELKQAIIALTRETQTDSPVYTFLPALRPPRRVPRERAHSSSRPEPPLTKVGASGAARPSKQKCFVTMGFGEKQDLVTGRTLDLDKTYRIIIKKAVEEAGLECIRADDIIYAGVIDKPMFELLLDADVVVADLSTSNANALYELGVRHALRPHTTIVIAEKGFKFPFDIKSLVIRGYEHLGKGLDADEADRMRSDLAQAMREALKAPRVDSPVYTFLPDLRPPELDEALASASAAKATDPRRVEAGELEEAYREAKERGDWKAALRWLQRLFPERPPDPRWTQQLALATFKSNEPDRKSALVRAREILRDLEPETTKDPETLSLWGTVHKRLWDLDHEREVLDTAIRAYSRAFELSQDHASGINLAFLLASRASQASPEQAAADRAHAAQVWRQVVMICESQLKEARANAGHEATFWIMATLAEALTGLGESRRAEEVMSQAASYAPSPSMVDILREQLGRLRPLLGAAVPAP